jgi:hypothetical protein
LVLLSAWISMCTVALFAILLLLIFKLKFNFNIVWIPCVIFRILSLFLIFPNNWSYFSKNSVYKLTQEIYKTYHINSYSQRETHNIWIDIILNLILNLFIAWWLRNPIVNIWKYIYGVKIGIIIYSIIARYSRTLKFLLYKP